MITGEDKIAPNITMSNPTNARIFDSAVGTALMIQKTGDAGCLILKRMVKAISRLILARIARRICKVVMVVHGMFLIRMQGRELFSVTLPVKGM